MAVPWFSSREGIHGDVTTYSSNLVKELESFMSHANSPTIPGFISGKVFISFINL